MKMYIGPPSLNARLRILRTCIGELIRVGILHNAEVSDTTRDLWETRDLNGFSRVGMRSGDPISTRNWQPSLPSQKYCSPGHCQHHFRHPGGDLQGLSGRALRRLPFQAHAMFLNDRPASSLHEFYVAMHRAIEYELETQRKTSAQHTT
jgi:hypothetical protein